MKFIADMLVELLVCKFVSSWKWIISIDDQKLFQFLDNEDVQSKHLGQHRR